MFLAYVTYTDINQLQTTGYKIQIYRVKAYVFYRLQKDIQIKVHKQV